MNELGSYRALHGSDPHESSSWGVLILAGATFFSPAATSPLTPRMGSTVVKSRLAALVWGRRWLVPVGNCFIGISIKDVASTKRFPAFVTLRLRSRVFEGSQFVETDRSGLRIRWPP